jgi:polyamine oxidase
LGYQLRDNSVCIIGAGIAGLAAGRQLKKAGVNVVLLEARSYAGGRIYFDYSLGIPFPMGAAFVHRDHEDFIYHQIEKYNPTLYDLSNAPIIVFEDNKNKFNSNQLSNAKKYFEQLLKKNKLNMSFANADISLLESINQILNNDMIDINQRGLSWELLYLSLFTGIDSKHLSAKHWDQMREIMGDSLLLTSYDPLIKDISSDQKIHFKTCVTSVDYSGNQVKLQTNNGTFTADKVLVTVPLGVLQSEKIKFKPTFPALKQSAIQSLGMSQLNKIGLLFPFQFWPKEEVIIGYNSAYDAIPIFMNYAYFFEKPILLGGVSGDYALRLENEGAVAFVEQAMKTLRYLFGNNIPDPVSTVTTNWINDPFSQGSYSYIPVGASGKDFDILAEAIDNKIFFAGESTYRDCHSTVQGAYLSGLRESNRILESLK